MQEGGKMTLFGVGKMENIGDWHKNYAENVSWSIVMKIRKYCQI